MTLNEQLHKSATHADGIDPLNPVAETISKLKMWAGRLAALNLTFLPVGSLDLEVRQMQEEIERLRLLGRI